MTKSRFKALATRGPCVAALALVLFGCASSAGEPAAGFMNTAVQAAYLPLSGAAYLVMEGHGAAVVIAPGIAVTNAHNANLIASHDIIGTSVENDLMFFRVKSGTPLPEAAPFRDEQVVAYGQGLDDGLRAAYGTVKIVNAPVLPNCATCHVQKAFTFESIAGRADAGPGFSGGPVVDRTTGALVGITFGFRDDDKSNTRLMYAYDLQRVRAELSAIESGRAVAQK
jgi:S1-C subfamily serine protease